MKFVLATHGTRGDVEPCAAVGMELLRRGHDVCMAVPPNLIGFVEAAGLTGVAYGPDSGIQINQVAAFVHNLTKAQNPFNLAQAGKQLFVEGWAEMGRTLTELADGADLLMTGQTYHGVVANVAEYHHIPIAALHHFPMHVNGQVGLPSVPMPAEVARTVGKASWRLYSYTTKDADRAQRRELGLPPASAPRSNASWIPGRRRFRPTTRRCFPDSSKSGTASGRSSVRCRCSCTPNPTTNWKRGSRLEHRRSTSVSVVRRCNHRPRRSR